MLHNEAMYAEEKGNSVITISCLNYNKSEKISAVSGGLSLTNSTGTFLAQPVMVQTTILDLLEGKINICVLFALAKFCVSTSP